MKLPQAELRTRRYRPDARGLKLDMRRTLRGSLRTGGDIIDIHKLGRIEKKTGQMSEFNTGAGSAPRRVAAAPDGTLWVTLYGNGKLLHFDPVAATKLREYDLPGGANGGPYAVTVDGAGNVFADEISANTVVRLNPANGELRVVKLPTENTGIRKMIVDASGRVWYMGSHSGKLGMIQ